MLCPKKCIDYPENIMGQYKSRVDLESCIECKLCEKVCPLLSTSYIHKNLPFKEEVGYYDKCYKGYDKRFRKTSASGGLLTACLYELLKSGKIDTVICVGANSDKEDFYKYNFVTDPDELKTNSLSAYYPLHIDEVMHRIMKHEGKYGMVVLPCQAKGIRELQKRNRILRERIVYLFGLVCGGMPGKSMVEYVACEKNISLENVKKIAFREKRSHYECDDCAMSLYINNVAKYSNMKNDSFGFAYLNKLFHYPGCNVCDDIFAEHADAAFMDAWLEKERREVYGTSIIISRNKDLTQLLDGMMHDNPDIEGTSVETAVKAQSNVGLIQRKKKQSFFKMRLYRKFGYLGPVSDKKSLTLLQKLKFSVRFVQEFCVQRFAQKVWSEFKKGNYDFAKTNKKLHRYVKNIKRI